MNLPVKIGLATLGGGAVAVGGHETYALATGKPGWIVQGSKSSINNPNSNSKIEQPNIQEKQKILNLIGNDFNCTVKVWINNEDKDINDVSNENQLTGLLSYLNEIKDKTCGTSLSPKKSIVLKKETNGSWSEINETKQVKELATAWNGKCTIKIKTESSEYKNVIEDLGSITLDNLYEKVKALKTECQTSNDSTKEMIFQKKNGSSEWTKMSEKDQILELKTKWNGKCTIKVKPTNEQTVKDINENSTDNELLDLLKVLNNKKSECESATNKEIIFHKPDNSNWSVYTDKQQVDAWIQKTSEFHGENKTCVLKIRISDTTKDIEEGQDLVGLPAFLETSTVKIACSSVTGNTPKEIVVQKIGNEWSIYPTQQQIKDLKDSLDANCTINIKDSQGTSKTIDNITNQTSLINLFKILTEAKKTDCASLEGGNKKTLNYKESSNNTWTKE